MIIKKELVKREIAGESFLIPVGKTVYDYNGLFSLTDVGAFIWDLLPNVDTVDKIVSRILDEYDVDEKTATDDVNEFLNTLKEMDII